MVNLNGHEAGNGGHSQGKPIAYRDSSTRRDGDFSPTKPLLRAEPSFNAYCCSLVDCDATACHLPFRLTHTSVKRYMPLISCPLYVPFTVLVPAATAVSP